MTFSITDKPGAISKELMRNYFETSIKSTKVLRENTSLATMTINDEFHHYMDPDTDTMWIGFALGMRCAERLAAAEIGAAIGEKAR